MQSSGQTINYLDIQQSMLNKVLFLGLENTQLLRLGESYLNQ